MLTLEQAAEICRPHNENIVMQAEIDRLRAALKEIAEMHKGDQPAAYGMSDLEWADRHIRHMRVAACEALKPKFV